MLRRFSWVDICETGKRLYNLPSCFLTVPCVEIVYLSINVASLLYYLLCFTILILILF